MVCHALLVETGDGLVLVDGGIGTGDVANPARLGRSWLLTASPRLDLGETAIAQVQALGYDPRDVRHLVLTHLDLDHAGAIPDFPWAKVHVHAREVAASKSAGRGAAAWRYIREQMPTEAQVAPFEDGGDRWFGFEGVRAFGDRLPDLLFVPLPGHTLGHTGVAVRDGDRWLFHAGDAYFFHGQIAEKPSAPFVLRMFQRRADTARELRVKNQERVRRVALDHAGEVDVFCAHDAVELDRFVARGQPAMSTVATNAGARRAAAACSNA